MSKSSEHCTFCGWNRRTCWQNIRFYSIPREPGLKRIRWLQVFGNRPITHRDRVCSVHFRCGRPSNDPSHEDFVPHLYLTTVPPPEVMSYFQQATDKESDCVKILAADASVVLISKETGKQDNDNENDKDILLLPLLSKKSRNFRPAIMQRKRRQTKDEQFEDENVIIQDGTVNEYGENKPPRLKKLKRTTVNFDYQPRHELTATYNYNNRKAISQSNLNQYRRITNNTILSSSIAAASRTAIPLDRHFVQSTGIQAGQTFLIKRKPAGVPHRIPIIPRYQLPPIHNLQDPKVVYRGVTPRVTSPMTFHRSPPRSAPSHYHHSSTQEEDLVNQQLQYIGMQTSRDDEDYMLEEEAEAVRQMHEQEIFLQTHHQQMLAVSQHQHNMPEFEDDEEIF